MAEGHASPQPELDGGALEELARYYGANDWSALERFADATLPWFQSTADRLAIEEGYAGPPDDLISTVFQRLGVLIDTPDTASFADDATRWMREDAEARVRDAACRDARGGFEDRLEVMVHRMEKPLRQVLRAHGSGLDTREAATLLGLSENEYDTRLARAAARLDELLEDGA